MNDNNNNYCELKQENCVLNLGDYHEKFFVSQPMLKLGELLQSIKYKLLHISEHDWHKKGDDKWVIGRKKWIEEGIDCEILNLGAKDWKKGKVKIKITVEFCSDEPELSQSLWPLDDIRQTLDRTQQ